LNRGSHYAVHKNDFPQIPRHFKQRNPQIGHDKKLNRVKGKKSKFLTRIIINTTEPRKRRR